MIISNNAKIIKYIKILVLDFIALPWMSLLIYEGDLRGFTFGHDL